MPIEIFQHVHFEGAGAIAAALQERGARLRHTRWYAGDRAPALEDCDAVVVMGGPMSVNDETDYPWLREEKQFVERAIRAGVPVLGICLGAQIIAAALGARVYTAPQREIGWFALEGLDDGPGGYRFPQRLQVMHWHAETFDLPPGARHLARTPGCENQAFCVGSTVLGLQFHLEMGLPEIEAIIAHCGADLEEGAWVQSAATIRALCAQHVEASQRQLGLLLNSWLGQQG